MSFGILSKNASGETQIDGDYKNFRLLGNGSSSISAYGTSCNTPDTTQIPIFAFQPSSSYYACASNWVKSGSTYTEMQVFATGSFTMNWGVFTDGPLATPSWGGVVFDSSGNRVFTSDDKPLKILSSNTVYQPLFGASSGYKYVTVNSSSNYFILFPFSWHDWTAGEFPCFGYREARMIKVNSSTQIVVGCMAWTSWSLPTEVEYYSYPDYFTLIEVTW